MRRAIFLGLSAAVVAAMAFALTGRDSGSAQAAVRRAAMHTLDIGSARFTITFALTDASAGDPNGEGLPSFQVPQQIVFHGATDYRRHLGTIRYEVPGEFESVLVYDGDTTYVKWPDAGFGLPKDKPWVKSTGGGSDPFDPQMRALRDPASVLHFLRLSSSSVRESGTEEIGATATTRYDGTLDFQKIVDQAPAAQRDELQVELDLMREDPLSVSIAYSIWVDSSDVARRVLLEDEGGSTTIDFFDFGAPVEIDVPPPSAVLSDEEFTKLMEQQVSDSQCTGDGGGGSSSSPSDDTGGSLHYCITVTAEGGG